ncbi:hypothetical protein FRC00_009963 [Tulasnella sp. 408]|nr:hypothetical protein FRC00_009963 [Tulasnella sp. 408]
MVIGTHKTTGKRKAVTYEEQDLDDDVQMNDAPPLRPEAELDEYKSPMKKLRAEMDSSSPILPQQDIQGTSSELRKTYPFRCPKTQVLTVARLKASESGDDDDSPSSKRQKPRESPTATGGEGKEQAIAQLHTLFDKLPTDAVYMNKPHASFASDVEGKRYHPL